MKKRILQFSVVVILLFSGLWTAVRHDGKEPMDTRKASQYLIPSRERYWAVIKTEPYAMFDFPMGPGWQALRCLWIFWMNYRGIWREGCGKHWLNGKIPA